MNWISLDVDTPDDETPVLILLKNGRTNVAEIRTEHPSFEDTNDSIDYWISSDEKTEYEWDDIAYWAYIVKPVGFVAVTA